jgi:hypothetical protein
VDPSKVEAVSKWK